METDIRTVWEKVCLGDLNAWTELVHRYAGLVHTVAMRARLTDQDAEDCAQQTWLALYRRRSSIKDPVALPAWLIRTTHREAVRMAKRYPAVDHAEKADSIVGSEKLPDSIVLKLELEAAIEQALTQMDHRCRKLIRALYLSDAPPSYRSLASSLGIKPNSLGPLRSRCLKRLKEILKKNGYPVD